MKPIFIALAVCLTCGCEGISGPTEPESRIVTIHFEPPHERGELNLLLRWNRPSADPEKAEPTLRYSLLKDERINVRTFLAVYEVLEHGFDILQDHENLNVIIDQIEPPIYDPSFWRKIEARHWDTGGRHYDQEWGILVADGAVLVPKSTDSRTYVVVLRVE